MTSAPPPPRSSRLPSPLTIVALLVIGTLYWTRCRTDVDLPQDGRPAPPLAGIALDGGRLDLADLRGKTVLIDFWATWCGPCIREMPRLKALRERYAGRGFEILGVVGDDAGSAARVREAVETQGLPWPQLYDDAGSTRQLFAAWGIRAMPTMILIGPDGKILSRSARADLEDLLETHVGS